MKVPSIPGLNITINIGMGATSEAPPKEKPQIAPEVMQKRLANLRKGRVKKMALSGITKDVYPKPVTKIPPETKGLEPTPRPGYYR